MSTHYMPAWKRLGLKLQHQSFQTPPDSPTDTSNAASLARKRKLSQEHDADSELHGNFKRQQHQPISIERGTLSNSPRTSTEPESQASTDSRRKSVTFSADTKVEDGCSSKRLVQAAYASRLAAETNENGIPNGTSKTVELSKSRTEKSNRSRQLKKPIAQPSSKVEVARQKNKRELALQYLEQYANARATWKFNKKRQNTILKMALDINGIPAQHSEALKSYLEGLQSTTLRQELRAQAKESLAQAGDASDPKDTDNAKNLRAKLILDALGHETVSAEREGGKNAHAEIHSTTTAAPLESKPDSASKPQVPASSIANPGSEQEVNGTAKKRRRRRVKKRRTTVRPGSDSDSSSSDDESGNDSSDN